MTAAQQSEKASPTDKHTIVFMFDLRDPFSYLGLGPALELARAYSEASVDWLPIRRHTLLPPSVPDPQDDRSIQHRRARAEMIAREIAVYADAQGITVDSPYRDGHADATYRAWLWVRATAPARLPDFLKAVFEAYWTEKLDPENEDEILPLLAGLNFDRDEFKRWASSHGETTLRALEARLEDAGIAQAPAYRVEDEVFYGRQHLPMIRWILDGRPERGPI